MKKTIQISLIIAAAVLAVGLSAGRIYAEGGSGGHDGNQDSSSSDSENNDQDTSDDHLSEADKKAAEAAKKAAEAAREAAQQNDSDTETEVEDSVTAHGNNILKELRSSLGGHRTRQQRQQHCEARKQGLETKFTNYVNHAKQHKSAFDSVLAGAVLYQQTNKLDTVTLSSLLTSAQAAGSQATSSIAVLESTTPSLDCSQDSVASDVSKFKAAVEQARSDILKYRASILAFLDGLETASNGGTQ